MRFTIGLTLAAAMMFLITSVGCEPVASDKGNTGTAKHDDHEGHDEDDGHNHAKKKEAYHPGHSPFGLVYHIEGHDEAVAVSLTGDKGTVTITNRPKSNTEKYEQVMIDAEEVTIIPPKAGKEDKQFTLAATNADDDGKASVFELDDPALAVIMSGDFTVAVELDGETREYSVFSHSH